MRTAAQFNALLSAIAEILPCGRFVPSPAIAERTLSIAMIARNKWPFRIGSGLNIRACGQNRRKHVRVHVSYRALLRGWAFRPHLDETGFRIRAKTRWLHSASTAVYTYYRVGEKRGDVPRTMADGVIVHDHFKAYYALRGAQHALCNAHHLRELQALIEIEKEPWACVMHELLRAANKQVREAKAGGAVALVEADTQPISVAYDAALAMGFALHEGQAPLVRTPGARGRPPRRTGQDTICCSACANAKSMSCASLRISTCRSPTTRRSRTSA